GTKIAFQVVGSGVLDLLVFSGAQFGIDIIDDEPSLARAFRRMTSYSRVARFDTRGVGMSDPVVEPPGVEDWAGDALAVMDAAGSDRPAVFSSIGEAAAALLLAARHPERVRSLVIVNGFACVRRSADYPIGASDEVITAVLESHHLMADGFDFVAALAPSLVGN